MGQDLLTPRGVLLQEVGIFITKRLTRKAGSVATPRAFGAVLELHRRNFAQSSGTGRCAETTRHEVGTGICERVTTTGCNLFACSSSVCTSEIWGQITKPRGGVTHHQCNSCICNYCVGAC